jgi:hypothetical protein
MLQKISREDRSGNLNVEYESQRFTFTCFEGRIITLGGFDIDSLLNFEEGVVEFERGIPRGIDHDTPSIAPGEVLLDLVERGFNFASEFETEPELEQSPEFHSGATYVSDSVIESEPDPGESVERALQEAANSPEFIDEIIEEVDRPDSRVLNSLKSLEPSVDSYDNHRVSGNVRAFNYTCLIPEVSRGLITIIGFGFIAFSAFILPRLFGGLFDSLANMVLLP